MPQQSTRPLGCAVLTPAVSPGQLALHLPRAQGGLHVWPLEHYIQT